MNEHKEHATRKKTKIGKIVLLLLLLAICVSGIFFACSSFTAVKSLPIVYEKNNMLMIKTDFEKKPFVVSKHYAGGPTAVLEGSDALLFTDADNALCYTKIKKAADAMQTKILTANVFNFVAPDSKHIYYIRDGVLYKHNLKGETKIADNVQEMVATEDGQYLFYNTATDLFGIIMQKDEKPVHIAEDVNVYNIIRDANDWGIHSDNMYYLADGTFAKLNPDLSVTDLDENVVIGFVLDSSVFSITEHQIDEDKFLTTLVKYGPATETIATELIGIEAVSQIYTDKTYMLFTKASEKNPENEAYYTLDAAGNFRYLCENENYQNFFANADGSHAYFQTEAGDLLEYELTKNGSLKTNTKKVIASGVQKAYPVKDHIGISGENAFGVYHKNRYEEIYNDGEPHYPRFLVENKKAYICDQAGTAPFYVCKNNKLRKIDDNVVMYTLISDVRVAYLKAELPDSMVFDLYKMDNVKKPTLIDTDVTAIH